MAETTETPRSHPLKRNVSSAHVGKEDDPIKGTIVLDNGSGVIKAGFGGESEPRFRIPAVVGRKKVIPQYNSSGRLFDESDSHLFLGDEADESKHELVLEHPTSHGIVENWEHMERVWDYIFVEKLKVEIDDYIVMLTEPVLNPTKNREKMAELMFETFNVPALFIGVQALLALYSEGLTTGLVVDIGDGVTHIVPVYEGYAINQAIVRQNLAGRDLTEYFSVLLKERGFVMDTSAQREVVREIKEKLCYVTTDFDAEMQKAEIDQTQFDKTFILPDGQEIVVGDQRFRCPEALFRPSLLGRDIPSLSDLLVSSVRKCAIDVRKPLLNNLLISGGTTMFEGFAARLAKTLNKDLCSSLGVRDADVNIIAPQQRQDCVWRGGSVLSSLSTFENMVITWEEYEEVGVDIVHKKCNDLSGM